MKENYQSFRDKKIISIGNVSELLGLSIRQIRYYEERGLILPARSTKGTRKFSLKDIEILSLIAECVEEGVQTIEIKQMLKKRGLPYSSQKYKGV